MNRTLKVERGCPMSKLYFVVPALLVGGLVGLSLVKVLGSVTDLLTAACL